MNEMQLAGRFSVNLIENHRNELLFLKRSAVNRIAAGYWAFPAGRIESDETPEMCSQRELAEETGSKIDLILLGRYGPVADRINGMTYEFFLFHYRYNGGEVVLNEEHTAYAWVSKEKYRNYRVMRGVDIDIDCFGIWPRSYLNSSRLRD